MKKFSRIAALILAAVMLTLTLCSCNYLDSARAHQAFYTDDTRREIEFEGRTYKYINPNNYDFVHTDIYYQDRAYYVTQKDVPVLLASHYGMYMMVTEGKELLYLMGSERPVWFVRDDMYEKMSSLLADPKLDHYFYQYTVEDEVYGGLILHNALLNDEMTALIERTCSIDQNEKISLKNLDEDEYYSNSITLYSCDKDMRITRYRGETWLIRNGADYYIRSGVSYSDKVLCPVKEEDIPMIKAFFEANENALNNYGYYPDDIHER